MTSTQAASKGKSPETPSVATTLYAKWKPDDRFIISMDDPDDIVRRSSKLQAVDRKVPPQNRFHWKEHPSAERSFGAQLEGGVFQNWS